MKDMSNRTEYIEGLNLEMNKQSDIEALLIEFEQGRISRDEYIALSFMSHSVTRSDAHTDTFNRQQERIDKLKATNPWIKVSERLPEIEENNSRVALPMHVITTNGRITIADYTRSIINRYGREIVSISYDPIWICREQGCEMTNEQIQVELYQPLPTAPKD